MGAKSLVIGEPLTLKITHTFSVTRAFSPISGLVSDTDNQMATYRSSYLSWTA